MNTSNSPLYFELLPREVFHLVAKYSTNCETADLQDLKVPKIPRMDLFAPSIILNTYNNYTRDLEELKRVYINTAMMNKLRKEGALLSSGNEKLEQEQLRAAKEKFGSRHSTVKINRLENPKNIFKMVQAILGGEIEYSKLPIYEGQMKRKPDCLEIEVNKVHHPIMRGSDEFERDFFIIKATCDDKSDDEGLNGTVIQVFYQKISDQKPEWVTSGPEIVRTHDDGSKNTIGVFTFSCVLRDLHKLVKTGELNKKVFRIPECEWIYSEKIWYLNPPTKINEVA